MENSKMSHDECDRLLIVEQNQSYDRSRMGELCVRVTHIENNQKKVLNLLIKIKYFAAGIFALLGSDTVGLTEVLKAILA